jgi:hypothetical protein
MFQVFGKGLKAAEQKGDPAGAGIGESQPLRVQDKNGHHFPGFPQSTRQAGIIAQAEIFAEAKQGPVEEVRHPPIKAGFCGVQDLPGRIRKRACQREFSLL